MASPESSVKKPVKGRGRARINLAALNPKPGFAPITPRVELESLELCLKESTNDKLESCLAKVEEFAINEDRIQKVANVLFEKCLTDKNMAGNGGQVAAVFISSEKIGVKFRNTFLGKFQENYKNREQLRESEFEKYLCFSVFMCSIYKNVFVNGQVLKILTKPVYAVLNELMDGKEKDTLEQRVKELEVFRDNLLMVASLLQDNDKVQMDEMFVRVRGRIIEGKTPKVSCILLETLECYLKGVWVVEDQPHVA